MQSNPGFKRIASSVLGSYYDHLVRARHSSWANRLKAAPFRRARSRQFESNRPYLPFQIRGSMGFGGMMTHVVQMLDIASRHAMVPVTRAFNPLYAQQPNQDVLSQCFSRKFRDPDIDHLKFLPISSKADYAQWLVDPPLSIEGASKLFHEYFEITGEIQDVCSDFLRRYDLDSFPMGIHFRGTDKRYEAALMQPEAAADCLSPYIEACDASAPIFLATDVPDFEAILKRNHVKREFASFAFKIDPKHSNAPRHFSSLSGKEKTIEAMVNMILLGKSSHIFRTRSLLSAWSKILNPSVKVTTFGSISEALDFPESGFPARLYCKPVS